MSALRLYVGTYSHAIAGMDALGKGVYRMDLDLRSGQLSAPVLAAACPNPSYLARGTRSDRLYAVQELFANEGPGVRTFAVDTEGKLELLSECKLAGELPCHLAVDPSGRWLATAQYWSGDVALFGFDVEGLVGTPATIARFEGCGPDIDRQSSPHAHHISFGDGGRELRVVDLGSDALRVFAVEPDGSAPSLRSIDTIALPAGAGPRHLVTTANGDTMFVANELDETIATLRRSENGWRLVDVCCAFERRPCQHGGLAAIRLSPDERQVYVSGRRQGMIAWFDRDAGTSALRESGRIACGGALPRDFVISADGAWVVVANQGSNHIVCLSRDTMTGALAPGFGQVYVPTPVALLAW